MGEQSRLSADLVEKTVGINHPLLEPFPLPQMRCGEFAKGCRNHPFKRQLVLCQSLILGSSRCIVTRIFWLDRPLVFAIEKELLPFSPSVKVVKKHPSWRDSYGTRHSETISKRPTAPTYVPDPFFREPSNCVKKQLE
jgi:hypothetical protein